MTNPKLCTVHIKIRLFLCFDKVICVGLGVPELVSVGRQRKWEGFLIKLLSFGGIFLIIKGMMKVKRPLQ